MIYIPVWKRSPNKFIRYEDRPFTLPANTYGIVKSGIETIAIFKDKNGNEQEMQAFIKWTGNNMTKQMIEIDVPEWQTIESAPKDRPVLLYVSRGPITCRCFVGNAYDSWPWEPTHWMELPKTPNDN